MQVFSSLIEISDNKEMNGMNKMHDRMLDRILFSTAEKRAVHSGKRSGKYFFTHSLEESKIDIKKYFKNLIISKFFFFFVFTLLHLFVQNTSISDEGNIYGKVQLSSTYSRKLAEQGKSPPSMKVPASTVKKNNVSEPSLQKEEHLQNKEETSGSGPAEGDSANVKASSSGEAEAGAAVKAESSETATTSRDAAATSSDTAATSGDTATPTSDSTTSSSDATTASSATTSSEDSEGRNGNSTTSSGEGTTSDGQVKVLRSCLKNKTGEKREKRKVHFANPLEDVKIFCQDESEWSSDEEEQVKEEEEEEEEDMGDDDSGIIFKEGKNRRTLFLSFWKKKKALKMKAWAYKWRVRGTANRNKSGKHCTEQEEANATSAETTNRSPGTKKGPVNGRLRRVTSVDNLSV
ncbi:Uncharacterized protein PCOAH_00048190 [Plasmodium coatneyi]|uniref:Uncharacterized protein n=1 Tax=Plasmodium coatneyi TaxID=208452 RepID=A0A1B1E6A7_9APIC|nr:Uncharacterized protein PCOAH_00048190 [Plasmodium coatneyi]ANQ10507.1 Uncharacterized protein PCOAH_00048190 [Plasmodium coatneyi]